MSVNFFVESSCGRKKWYRRFVGSFVLASKERLMNTSAAVCVEPDKMRHVYVPQATFRSLHENVIFVYTSFLFLVLC